MSDDLRSYLDPLAATLAARPRWRTIPEQTYTPDPTDDEPDPDPVVLPERTEFYVDPTELPPEVGGVDTVDVAGQVAILHSALAWMWDRMEIRQVTGFAWLPDGVYTPFFVPPFPTYTLNIEWRTTPEKLPTFGTAQPVSFTPSLLGPFIFDAAVTPGTLTLEGCQVEAAFLVETELYPAVGNDPGVALGFEVAGTYAFVPPYESPEPDPEEEPA